MMRQARASLRMMRLLPLFGPLMSRSVKLGKFLVSLPMQGTSLTEQLRNA